MRYGCDCCISHTGRSRAQQKMNRVSSVSGDRAIWFIRHGESQANAGHATSDPQAIRLTELGRKQADSLAVFVPRSPGAIVTSPYVRTRETAAPTMQRFPEARHEVWPIQEFTYLAPERCRQTTAEDRRPLVDHYWTQADPDFIDGPGAESFAQMLARTRVMWHALQGLAACNFTLVFGHGLFFNALRWSLAKNRVPLSARHMSDFRDYHRISPVPNGSILKCQIDRKGQSWFAPQLCIPHREASKQA